MFISHIPAEIHLKNAELLEKYYQMINEMLILCTSAVHAQ
jgi:hypothetical protein